MGLIGLIPLIFAILLGFLHGFCMRNDGNNGKHGNDGDGLTWFDVVEQQRLTRAEATANSELAVAGNQTIAHGNPN